MLIFSQFHSKWFDIRHGLGCILILALVACTGQSLPQVVTPTQNQLAHLADRLSTPTPRLSGKLGVEINQYILQNYPLFSGSILVSQNDEILISSGYRYANWELNVPNLSTTKFRLASLTKPFTALAIMMLQERGQLDVNDPVCKYLTDCPAAWEPITIDHLLTHTSGIPDYAALPGALNEAALNHTVTELIDTFRDEPLEFSPGTKFSYSNSGYVLLGAVIESVSGASYEEFMFDNIFSPLSMRDSGFDNASRILKGRASGYTIDGRALENSAYVAPSNLYATAGLFSTVEDLFRWIEALNASQLVSQPTLELIFSPQVAAPELEASYGYGWVVSEKQGHRSVWHEGRIPGFHNYIANYPDDKLDIIILSNLETSEVAAIAQGIEEMIFQQDK